MPAHVTPRFPQTGATPGQIRTPCRAVPAVFFAADAFTVEPDEQRVAREEIAKAVCRLCPIRPACLSEALDRREGSGVWGGMTEAERAALLAPKH